MLEPIEPVETPFNTPSSTTDEDMETGRMESSSSSWSSPRRYASFPKAKLSRSPRKQRARSRRDVSKGSHKAPPMAAPLSDLTLDMSDVPIKDMVAWVHRTAEVRKKEVAAKGKILRPMNSFMLYRSAYAERAKKLLRLNNFQLLNTAIAQSWSMEPLEIRNMYIQLARIERDNHANTYPEYKFKPQKGPATTKRVYELTPPASTVSEPIADPGSLTDWDDTNYPFASSSFHQRSHSYDIDLISSRTSSPFDCAGSAMCSQGYLSTSWNTSYPTSTLPTVQPGALYGDLGTHIEDVNFRRASSMPQEMQYTVSNGLAGLPGATHAELLQPLPIHPAPARITDGGNLDPQMLSYENIPSGLPITLGPTYPAVPDSYPVWDGEMVNPCYLTTSAQPDSSSPAPYHPQMAISYPHTVQRNRSWDSNQHDPNGMSGSDWFEIQTPVKYDA